MNFGTVAILGPGLLGGSLALALAERGLAKRLVIYARSARALDAIRTAGVEAELTDNPKEAVRDADVVILCVPIEAMPALVHEMRDALKPTALVTDVGSVKGSVDRALTPLLEDRALWIGSHPMAGSEQGGFAASRADLLEGAVVIVTPTKHTQRQTIDRVHDFWSALGGRLFTLDPQKHDQLVAEISHIPHLIAAALVNQASDDARDLAGSGFRDTTRVASGSPELWAEILMANRDSVTASLGRLITMLESLQSILVAGEKKDLLTPLKIAQSLRAQLLEKKPTLNKRS